MTQTIKVFYSHKWNRNSTEKFHPESFGSASSTKKAGAHIDSVPKDNHLALVAALV